MCALFYVLSSIKIIICVFFTFAWAYMQASEYCDGGILEFQTALGRVRMMLQVGLGAEEEKQLKEMLRYFADAHGTHLGLYQ